MRGGRPGGPDTLSPAARKAFFDTLRVPGMSRDLAARKAGIDPSTLYRWLARGKAKARGKAAADQQYRDFCKEVEQVEAEAETHALALIANAARGKSRRVTITKPGPNNTMITETRDEQVLGDWKAAAWILERRKAKKYGRRDHHTHAGDQNAPMVFELDTGGKPKGKGDDAPGPNAPSAEP